MHVWAEAADFSVSHACRGKSGEKGHTLIKNTQENATKTVCDSGPCRTKIPGNRLGEKEKPSRLGSLWEGLPISSTIALTTSEAARMHWKTR